MSKSADVRDDECPACDAATPGEWDEVLRVFVCPTCSTTWRRRPGRLVPPRPTQPSLLPSPPLDFECSEWPEDAPRAKFAGSDGTE